MRTSLFIAVAAILVASVHAVTFRPVAELTTNTVALISPFPDTSAPVLLGLWGPSAYNSNTGTNELLVTGSAAWTVNATVDDFDVTLTNGNDVLLISLGEGNCDMQAKYCNFTNAGPDPVIYKMLNSGAYSVSVSLTLKNRVKASWTSGQLSSNGWFSTVTVTPYVVGTTVKHLGFQSPTAGGCTDNGCTDAGFPATVEFSPAPAPGSVAFLFARDGPNAASGALFGALAVCNTTGTCDFEQFPLPQNGFKVYIGSTSPFSGNAISALGSTRLPKNRPVTVSVALLDGRGGDYITYFPESTVASVGGTSSVTFSVGTTDLDAPTCSAVSFGQTTVNTYSSEVPISVTLTCTDGTGSGLAFGFVVLRAVTAGTDDYIAFPVFPNNQNLPVPPYVTGTLSVAGVGMIDNAGNSVLYGTCGTAADAPDAAFVRSMCFGFTSSAASVAASVFGVLAVALLALLL